MIKDREYINPDFTEEASTILENIAYGILIVDENGVIRFCNPYCEEILGYKSDDLLGQSIRLLYGEDKYDLFREMMEQFRKGKPIKARLHAKHKTNGRVWTDIRSSFINKEGSFYKNHVISFSEIEKLKQTEAQLERSEAFAEAIINKSTDSIIATNEDGEIQSFNPSAEAMFGYSPDEVIGKNIKILMPFPHSDNHGNYIKEFLKTGEQKIIDIGREVQGIRKDGTVFPVEVTVSEVSWEGNRFFSNIIKNISERRDLERRISDISNQERRRIGQDLHDGLGQMLTGIRMVTENLAKKMKTKSLSQADEVKQISAMVQEADEYARSLTRGMVQIDLENKGLRTALEELCQQSEKMFSIRCTYSETGSMVIDNHTAALHIYRIVQEAINNAVKHGKAKNICVRMSNSGQHTSVVIDDDGVGFGPDFPANSKKGMGIQIMKYRAGILGGILELIRTKDDLTRVRCIIPNDLIEFN
ncbi:MAG: PAS domain S-box protein [Balneolaceae bacterium]